MNKFSGVSFLWRGSFGLRTWNSSLLSSFLAPHARKRNQRCMAIPPKTAPTIIAVHELPCVTHASSPSPSPSPSSWPAAPAAGLPGPKLSSSSALHTVHTVSPFSEHGASSSRPRSTHDVHLDIHGGTACGSGHKGGLAVGEPVGEALGEALGEGVGNPVGEPVGAFVGDALGSIPANEKPEPGPNAASRTRLMRAFKVSASRLVVAATSNSTSASSARERRAGGGALQAPAPMGSLPTQVISTVASGIAAASASTIAASTPVTKNAMAADSTAGNSPKVMANAAGIIKVAVGMRVGEADDSRVGDGVGAAVGSRVGDGVGEVVGSRVGDVGERVGARVGAVVGSRVGDAVGELVGALVGESVGALVSESVGDKVGG